MDLTVLSDILPTGYHGAVTAGGEGRLHGLRRRCRTVGLAAAASAHLLGAAVVIVGDRNEQRLAQARSFGCETVDVSQGAPTEQIEHILSVPEVDCGVDAVGFEARGHGKDASHEAPATVLNSLMDIIAGGGALGSPGLYSTGDPGAVDETAKQGSLSINLGTGWAKSLSFTTGQCPVMKYNRQLMTAILRDKIQIARAIPLEDAPEGYVEFDAGAATEYVLDPNGYINRWHPRPPPTPGPAGSSVRPGGGAAPGRNAVEH